MKKVAVLTGASSGMGRASIMPLSKAGFELVLAARRIEILNDLVKEVEAQGGKAIAVQTDLEDEDSTRNLFDTAMDAHGRIDAMINVAGYTFAIPGEYVSRDLLRKFHEINCFAPVQLMTLAAPVMRAQGSGRIITVTSAAAYFGGHFAGPYNASKSSCELFCDTLRAELSNFNIQVSTVVAGNIRTPMWKSTPEGTRQHVPWDDSNPYRNMLYRGAELAEETIRKVGKPPKVIADCILHAATAKRPKPRYFQPIDAKIQAFVLGRMIPVRLSGFIANRILNKKAQKTEFVVNLPDDDSFSR